MTIRRVPSGVPSGPTQKPDDREKPQPAGEESEFDQLLEVMKREVVQQGMNIISEEDKELKRQQSES